MRPLDITDTRTPEQLLAAGDHRWPDGRLYLPPHLAGRERRLYLRKLLLAEPEPPFQAWHRRHTDWYRAGGDVLCSCGEKYYDHPADPEVPYLKILCDRSRVKL